MTTTKKLLEKMHPLRARELAELCMSNPSIHLVIIEAPLFRPWPVFFAPGEGLAARERVREIRKIRSWPPAGARYVRGSQLAQIAPAVLS